MNLLKMNSIIGSLCLWIFFVSLVDCKLFSLRMGRNADENDEEINPAANTAINNLFRDIQIKLLGTSETFLGHTSDLFDNIQDALMPPDENGQSKPSELKKALRFLKTEARRRREDLEDEIEIEKEKAEEEAAKRRKEEEAKKRKKKKRHSNRRNSVKKRKAPAVDSAKNKTTAVLALEKEKKNSTKSFKLPINKTAELTTIQPYIVGSLGDGFGRHM